jgi:RNA polymerase sigma-70 factor (ECF subfamily)
MDVPMLSSGEIQRLFAKLPTDSEAADRLLALYRPLLRLLAEQAIGPGLRRREGASDIVQRTVLEAYAAMAQFQGSSEPEFSAWLKQILRRNVANLVRDNRAAKRDVRREQFLDVADGSISVTWFHPAARSTSPSERLIKAEAALNLAQALEQLPDEQQIAVRMRHLHGCSLDEIARTLDKSSAAVAGLLRRGLKALRELMGGNGGWK